MFGSINKIIAVFALMLQNPWGRHFDTYTWTS